MIKFSLEGTSIGHLVQHPAQSKASWVRLLRAVSSQGWIMSRHTDSTNSPENLLKCLTTLSVETFSYMGTAEGEIKKNAACR